MPHDKRAVNLEGPCPNIAGRDAAFRDDIGRLVSQTRNNICDRRADFYSDDKVIFRIPGTRIDPFSPGHDDDRVSFRDQTVGLSNDTLDFLRKGIGLKDQMLIEGDTLNIRQLQERFELRRCFLRMRSGDYEASLPIDM